MSLSAPKRNRLKVTGKFFCLCLPYLLIFLGFNQEVRPASPPEIVNKGTLERTSFETLQRIRWFAYGGVGYAGSISAGEEAFRAVFTNRNALGQFAVILTNGTTEAKLYALCGIRRLSPSDFETVASKLDTNAPVKTMHGCLASTERTGEILRRIRAGNYDIFISTSYRCAEETRLR